MIEKHLPRSILEKAIKSGNEFGWKESDFSSVIDSAIQNRLSIIGGQVQYVFPDGTCELYWLSYDRTEREKNEEWIHFCNRSAKECIDQFKIITSKNINEEAIENFTFLALKKEEGIDIENFKCFIIYFEEEGK